MTFSQNMLSMSFDRSSIKPPHTVLDELSLSFERVTDNGQSATLGAEGKWVGRLRRICAASLRHWGLPQLVDDAQLLLSELLTNALRHATARQVVVRIVLAADLLLLEVDDGSSGRPTVRVAGPDDESGRGMFLVSAIAASWGVSEDETTTWCALSFPAGQRKPC